MRVFQGLMFLGAGEFSVRWATLLEERLREGVSLSGGLQQSSQGMLEDHEHRARMEADLEDIVRDVAAALLAREVTFGADLPYPPDDAALRAYDEKDRASEDTRTRRVKRADAALMSLNPDERWAVVADWQNRRKDR